MLSATFFWSNNPLALASSRQYGGPVGTSVWFMGCLNGWRHMSGSDFGHVARSYG